MADTTNTTTSAQATTPATVQANGAPATATATDTTATRDELPKQLFATRDEALAAKPANPPKNTRAFEITKAGVVAGWILATGYDPAISRAAQVLDGYTATTGSSPAVTVEAAAAKLASLSDAELAALGLTRAKQAPTKGRGKQ